MSGIREALRKAKLLNEGKRLDDPIRLPTGNDETSQGFALVAYLPHEIEHLVKINATADEIKKIHAVEEVFPGSTIV